MAIPSTTPTKVITLSSDGWKRTGFPDGDAPPGALTMGTATKTETSITGVVVNANGATSFETRVDGGAPIAGLTASGLSGETQYSMEWRGTNAVGPGPWTTPVNVTTSAAGGVNLPAPNLFFDGFETEDISAPDGPAPALNVGGFAWSGIWNALVRDRDGDGAVGLRLYNSGGTIDPPTEHPGRDWRQKAGNACMLLSIAEGCDTMAEQSFTLDAVPERDLWVRYWWRIPVNYVPSDHTTSQHKIFVLFQDGYSSGGNGATCFMNIYKSGSMMQSGLLQREGTSGVAGGVGPLTDLFHPTNDRGRWMQFVIQHKLQSSPGVLDGEHRFWARFDGDDFTLRNEATGLDLRRSTESGLQGWAQGRIMSSREGCVSEREDYLVDNFELSTSPLVDI